MIKERPILFSAPMVRAIRAGLKTQTRRIVKCGTRELFHPEVLDGELTDETDLICKCPYGHAGGQLWVREAFAQRRSDDQCAALGPWYRADSEDKPTPLKWKPSIHMPRAIARIQLEVVAVRVERLQDITPDDCRSEGMPRGHTNVGVRYSFGQLWNDIHGRAAWDKNPWLWVIEFKLLAGGAA